MLRRLDWIRGCGIFGDYRWDPALPDLTRINVIYGPNGSGKTSLARALDALRNPQEGAPPGYTCISAKVEDDAGQRTTAGHDDPLFDRVLVFDEDYVDRNHRFRSGSPDMAAVLTLGQRTAEAEARLEEARALVAATVVERDNAKKVADAVEKQLTAEYERVSKAVVSDNKRAGGKYQSHGTYNAGTVKTAFAGRHDDWALLDDEGLAAKKQLIASDNREPLTTASFDLTVDAGLRARVAEALARTPVTIVLDTLKAHPEASSWVQEGHQFHAGLKHCIYCGQPLSDQRRRDIEHHFSNEVSALQADVDSLIEELRAIEASVDEILKRIPDRRLLFDDLRVKYDTAVKDARQGSTEVTKWCVEVRGRLERKKKNVLAAVETAVTEPPKVDGSLLEFLRDSHNKRVTDHDALVEAAAKAVELHHLKSDDDVVADLKKRLSDARGQHKAAVDGIAALRLEIAALENVEGDPTPSAQVLTRVIGQLLGRTELSFEAVAGRYIVQRDGQPAVGLSVGEKTAITLVHFLESVARFDASGGKPIVVIDDPVSSLDSNVFMGISTYIWSRTVVADLVAQVVLITHDFELFRQWDIQIEGLHKGGKPTREQYPAALYEIRSKHITTSAGKVRRCPVIASWPPSDSVRKKIRSTYHHAFISVAQAKQDLSTSNTLEQRLDAQLLFPNVIRRLLETFIAFKRPEWVGDFTGMMRRSAQLLNDSGYLGDADALRLRLTRYAHTSSHADTPNTDLVVCPDEVASAITAVFTFMNEVDEAHFAGLCEVTGVKPADLLQEPVSIEP